MIRDTNICIQCCMLITVLAYYLTFLLSVCEKLITDSEGILESPYYPNNYPTNLQCRYQLLNYEPGYQINFHFNNLHIESASRNGSCVKDYIEV